MILERVAAGEPVSAEERTLGAGLLAGLAEMYDGEHGLAYSAGALDIEPGHDRAVQLYAFYAHALAREDDVGIRYLAYIEANPSGAMAGEARWLLAASYEAAGQAENAIQILEPLRSVGDPEATAKLGELYARIGRAMPSAAPVAHEAPGQALGRRGPATVEKVESALDAAQAFATAGKRPDAYKKYREVLEADPIHPEALSWVQDYLRTKRDYAPLRDVLLAAVRAPGESIEARRDRLREVAGLCESNLRDIDGAIAAWKQLLAIDRSDETARQSLTRLLERTQRWDDLANLYEQDENGEIDLEKKLALQKKLATLHETKRKDLMAAAEVWERIANQTPEDEQATGTASKMFKKAGSPDRAAQVIAANAPSVTDPAARSGLLERLGELYEELDDPARAGDAYADGAGDGPTRAKLWEAAERCFVAAERWDRAGQAAVQRAELESDAKTQARHFARSADYLARGGDDAGALVNLVQASELDPTNEEYAQQLADRYTASLRWDDLVGLLLKRAENAGDVKKRVALRRQAADLYANQLGDKDAARETWRKILEDGDDEETTEHLVDDAIERGDHAAAAELLQRLEKAAATGPEKARIALREAELLADAVGDVEAAIVRYERILAELDPDLPPRPAGDRGPAGGPRQPGRRGERARARAQARGRSHGARADRHAARAPLRADRRHRDGHPRPRRRSKRRPRRLRRPRASVRALREDRAVGPPRGASRPAHRGRGGRSRGRPLDAKARGHPRRQARSRRRGSGCAHGAGRSGRRRCPRGVRRARRSARLARHRGDQARRVVARGKAQPGAHRSPAGRVRALRRGRPRSGRRARRYGARAQQGRRPAARRAPREAVDQDEGPRRALDGPRPHGARPDGLRTCPGAGAPGRGPRAGRRSAPRGDPARRGGSDERPSRRGRGASDATRGARRQADRRGRPLRAAGHPLQGPADRVDALARAAQVAGGARPGRSRARLLRSRARRSALGRGGLGRSSEPPATATRRPAGTRSGARFAGRSSKAARARATAAARAARSCGARR